MDGGDDQVEGGEDIVGIIEGAVVEDIAFDALENLKGASLLLSSSIYCVLFPDAFFSQSVGIEGALAVIADHQVFVALFDAGPAISSRVLDPSLQLLWLWMMARISSGWMSIGKEFGAA